jgi:Tfp pilus assembly protein PilN
MRAVNLIPNDQRKGASVGAGRSEGGAYAVLALLVVIAGLALIYGKATRSISSEKVKAATLTAEAQKATSEASSLAPYTSFVSLREQREQAVASLVDQRFDWAHAIHEFGRVLTKDVSISSLDGTIAAGAATAVTTGAPAPAASSTTTASSTSTPPASSTAAPSTGTTPASSATAASPVSSATPAGSVPTFSIAGCATSQRVVALTMQRLRLIDGVSEVTLQSSTKTPSVSGAGSVGGCSGPTFAMTVTFDALPSAAAGAAAVKSKDSTVSNTAAAGGAQG